MLYVRVWTENIHYEKSVWIDHVTLTEAARMAKELIEYGHYMKVWIEIRSDD